jgi:serine/threonine-protein kinase HipA
MGDSLAGVWIATHTRADLLAEADRFVVRRPQAALKDVRAALDHRPDFAKQTGLGEKAIAEIHTDFEPL